MKPAPTQVAAIRVAAIRAAAALRAATKAVAASAERPEQAVAGAPLEASAKPGAPAMDGGRAGLSGVPARPQPRDDAFVMSADARSAWAGWATVLIAESPSLMDFLVRGPPKQGREARSQYYPRAHAHTLRHTYASLCVAAG